MCLFCFICLNVLPAHMYMHVWCHRGQKKAVAPLELWLVSTTVWVQEAEPRFSSFLICGSGLSQCVAWLSLALRQSSVSFRRSQGSNLGCQACPASASPGEPPHLACNCKALCICVYVCMLKKNSQGRKRWLSGWEHLVLLRGPGFESQYLHGISQPSKSSSQGVPSVKM